jgi:hypothetical protein
MTVPDEVQISFDKFADENDLSLDEQEGLFGMWQAAWAAAHGMKDSKLAPDRAARYLKSLESETRWANHYALRAQEFRDAAGALLAYRDANTLNFQLEKLDDYLRPLRRLMEKQP